MSRNDLRVLVFFVVDHKFRILFNLTCQRSISIECKVALFCVMLGVAPRALWMLDKPSATEPHPKVALSEANSALLPLSWTLNAWEEGLKHKPIGQQLTKGGQRTS